MAVPSPTEKSHSGEVFEHSYDNSTQVYFVTLIRQHDSLPKKLNRMKQLILATCALLLAVVNGFAGNGTYSNLEKALNNRHDVRKIRITFAQLDSFPDVFDKFPNLEELNLSNNALTSLPPSLFRCKKLKVLLLLRNKLTTLPDELCGLTTLEELSVGYNELKEIPACIGGKYQLFHTV